MKTGLSFKTYWALAAARICIKEINFGLEAKALTVKPYMRSELEQTVYMRAAKKARRGRGEGEGGRRREDSRENRRSSHSTSLYLEAA